jgi:PrtD family type I secretion system ABC transporter
MLDMKKQSQPESPLYPLVQKCRRTFLFVALFSLCINLLLLFQSVYSLQVLDRVLSSHSVETLIMLTIIVVVAYIFLGVFMAIRTAVVNSVVEWLDYTLAPRLVQESIVRASLGITAQAGVLQRDLVSIKNFISGGGMVTLLDAPWALIYVFVIYMVSPILGLITVAGIVLLLAFGVINEYATRGVVKEASMLANKSQALADIASRNAEAIESMGMMHKVLEHWKDVHLAATRSQMKGGMRSNIIQTVSRVLRMINQVAITGVGGWLALSNELSIGGMIASSILVSRAMAPFDNAIGLWKSWILARDSYHRLYVALRSATLIERGNLPLPPPTGKLLVEGVIFTPPRSAPILKGVSFSLEAGETLGIIGPSGAGKSTLAKMIVGLLPPTHGTVRLDGAETFKWNRENFGSYVGYLPQNVDLFPGTIKDNIARLDKSASMEAVIEAAQRAHVHELILRLPNAYETECGLGNLGLSPGQRQRIGMARALYGDPRFVVLDEPNSNLDGEGERALIEALSDLKQQGISYVVVAHRPTIVSMVDRLLVMRGGVVERFGPREEMLRRYTAAGNPGGAPQIDNKPTQGGGAA